MVTATAREVNCEFCIAVAPATRTANILSTWLKALAVKLSRPSGRSGSYTVLIGFNPRRLQGPKRGMSSHATDFRVYAKSSSSSSEQYRNVKCPGLKCPGIRPEFWIVLEFILANPEYCNDSGVSTAHENWFLKSREIVSFVLVKSLNTVVEHTVGLFVLIFSLHFNSYFSR